MAVVAALMMPVMLGGLGLGAEVGYWYFNQRKLQNSADVAAFAGAVELRAGKGPAEIEAASLAAAEKTGFAAAIGSITTNSPPASGPFAADPDAVEVEVTENLARMFTVFFADGTVQMSGRATARVTQGAPACVLALAPNTSGAVTFTGSASVALDGCNVHSNSIADDAVTVTGSAQVETPCVSAVGGVSASPGLTTTACNSPIENAYLVADPYADLPQPPTTDPCEPENVFGGPAGSTYTISAGRYCGGLSISRTVTMNPGVYVIEGGEFKVNSSAIVDGAGVTFFLTGGATVQFNGSADLSLAAPTSGTYAGVLMFADPADPTATHVINGNSASFFDGAIYAPNANVSYSGSSAAAGGCTQIVAATIEFTGNAGIGTDCTGSSVSQINTGQLVLLVE